jgi:hypothetical protein
MEYFSDDKYGILQLIVGWSGSKNVYLDHSSKCADSQT